MKQVKNRLDTVFSQQSKKLSIFFTAGYPKLDSTTQILELLQESAVDFVEIGFPFSDPIADGSVIQKSNQHALANGMTLQVLFDQLRDIRKKITIPLILMGYFNPVEQYGFENFLKSCQEIEIDGLIIPDLPFDLLQSRYKQMINEHNIHFILLASPTSGDNRIKQLDAESTSFLYAVSSTAVTGGVLQEDAHKALYFERLKSLQLKSPITVGFGINSKDSLNSVHRFAQAGIIGSAFLKAIANPECYLQEGKLFLNQF